MPTKAARVVATETAAEPLERFRRWLRDRHLPVTQQRDLVAQVVFSGDTQLSVDDIAARLRDRRTPVGLATIYLALDTLVDAGFVRRTDVGDHVWRFESLAEDGDGQRTGHEHAHFLCTGCGEVTCMPELELKLPRGGQVPQSVRSRSVEVQLRGLCDDCG